MLAATARTNERTIKPSIRSMVHELLSLELLGAVTMKVVKR